MSTRYSLAQRTPLHNSLAAGIACAVTLALFAGSAMAAPGDLERVEVRGHLVEMPVRYDVIASCDRIETQLQDALQTTWLRERRAGKVEVQFVMQGGEIDAVKARGMSNAMQRAVRKAVNGLQCGPQQAATGIYRFQIDFADPFEDPDFRRDTRTASAQPGVRLALARD